MPMEFETATEIPTKRRRRRRLARQIPVEVDQDALMNDASVIIPTAEGGRHDLELQLSRAEVQSRSNKLASQTLKRIRGDEPSAEEAADSASYDELG